ncbi:2-amino-4-hydroxy-6-hydroxymethyldihydropteridine diphosphokinase [Leptothermofonsia sp. ETS-13]|uniref:2-amino-4-hydroxy-6- hydroxymethyldihydropteridine diphosphokinase n=1 Tax=Leptothermofonsia sp. ETS-13 TaxID=3035696 RepID=UPI003BA34305
MNSVPSGVMQPSPEATQLTLAAIALGSNLGDSLTTLESALERLSQTPGIELEARSHWYQTKPVGPPQPDYLNGCALLKVALMPEALLQALLQIEARFGRVRQERNGPRTLDLDLLLFDDLVLDSPNLQIPHPRMAERAFVLVPLAEIAPAWVEPVSGKAIAELIQTVDCSGVKELELCHTVENRLNC